MSAEVDSKAREGRHPHGRGGAPPPELAATRAARARSTRARPGGAPRRPTGRVLGPATSSAARRSGSRTGRREQAVAPGLRSAPASSPSARALGRSGEAEERAPAMVSLHLVDGARGAAAPRPARRCQREGVEQTRPPGAHPVEVGHGAWRARSFVLVRTGRATDVARRAARAVRFRSTPKRGMRHDVAAYRGGGCLRPRRGQVCELFQFAERMFLSDRRVEHGDPAEVRPRSGGSPWCIQRSAATGARRSGARGSRPAARTISPPGLRSVVAAARAARSVGSITPLNTGPACRARRNCQSVRLARRRSGTAEQRRTRRASRCWSSGPGRRAGSRAVGSNSPPFRNGRRPSARAAQERPEAGR